MIKRTVDVLIIGAGASGLMCALTAGYRGRSVLVLEHTNKVGRKILMSGGGRCNFTHLHSTPANFLSNNPHFCKSALSRYTPQNFVDMVERHGIEYHEKTPGQLFCNESSKEILMMLTTECDWAGVKIETEVSVQSLTQSEGGFVVETSAGSIQAESLVVATGGLSIPNGGATGFAYDVAEQFGLPITPRRAALVPFTLQPDILTPLKELSGTAQEARVSCAGVSFLEPILFTHRGISGPGVLQISSYWQPGQQVVIDLLPNIQIEERLKEARTSVPKQGIERVLSEFMSKRLAQVLCGMWGFGGAVGDYSNEKIEALSNQLTHWQVKPSGTEGYRTAEVTIGGIDTQTISQKTMEVKSVPGLYFIGESLDVTGHLGGHNFQWAWASGNAAGEVV
jgi:predicted Rossmann fold flavoprotein